MKLEAYCRNCLKPIRFTENVPDRYRLSVKYGNSMKLTCKKCNSVKEYHLNRIYAIPDWRITLFSLLVFIVGTVFLFWRFGHYLLQAPALSLGTITFFTIPSLLFFVIRLTQIRRCRYFNSFLI